MRQPYFEDVDYRVASDLTNTEITMNNTFWLGIFPGLGFDHLDYMAMKLGDFFSAKKAK